MTYDLKPRSFPNRYSFLQLVHNPLTCSEAFATMGTRHSQKKGWFPNCDKTKSVMNYNEFKPEPLCGLIGNSSQLTLGHFAMGIVIDSLNLAAILDWSNDAPEINNRARAGDVALPCRKRRLCHRNFTNDICHALNLLVTVSHLC